MKVLLIAYDFPPVSSPQSLRWAYLISELAELGHELHVLCPDLEQIGPGGLPAIPDCVRIHRTFPGPYMALVNRSVRKQRRGNTDFKLEPMKETQPGYRPATHVRKPLRAQLRSFLASNQRMELLSNKLNWRGRLAVTYKRVLQHSLFPDERGEWEWFARRVLPRLLAEVKPDVVITSHEPAVSIPLGAYCADQGYPWVADLGDPVLATYTPKRWRARAIEMEQLIGRKASLITVTNDTAKTKLRDRVPSMGERIQVLTQGFSLRPEHRSASLPSDFFDPKRLELLYTGSFYAFRRPEALLDAVIDAQGVRLTIATVHPPKVVIDAARQHPESIRIVGYVPHSFSLAMQSQADVLVNLANQDPIQVPGKFYEYLGAGKPILNIRNEAGLLDILLETHAAGWSVDETAASISARLKRLSLEKSANKDGLQRLSLARTVFQAHDWQALALLLVTWLEGVRTRQIS